MDKSGDGKISNSEVLAGFEHLEFEHKDPSVLGKITENVRSNNNKN